MYTAFIVIEMRRLFIAIRFHFPVHPAAMEMLLEQIIPLESHTSQLCAFYQLSVHYNLSDSIILRSDVAIVIPFPTGAPCPTHAHKPTCV